MDCAPSAAARLLIATVQPGGGAAEWEQADPGTCEASLRLAGAARLDALLCATLATAAPESLRQRSTREISLARVAWVEGARVLDALEAGGSNPIALKGADLSSRAWPRAWAALADRSMLRAAADLDVLVNPESVPGGEKALRELGYLEDGGGAAHHSRWRRADCGVAFSVEMHIDLFDRPHGLALDLPGQRARAVVVETPLGTQRRVLSAEDAFVHVAAHAVYSDALSDPVATLRAPLDLMALAASGTLDVGLIGYRAEQAGLGAAVGLAVEWSLALLGAPRAPFPELAARLSIPRGWRAAAGRRRTLTLANAATRGRVATRLPFTATRALLAPSAGAGLAMLLEGAKRRR